MILFEGLPFPLKVDYFLNVPFRNNGSLNSIIIPPTGIKYIAHCAIDLNCAAHSSKLIIKQMSTPDSNAYQSANQNPPREG
jgi:hypothetical protein